MTPRATMETTAQKSPHVRNPLHLAWFEDLSDGWHSIESIPLLITLATVQNYGGLGLSNMATVSKPVAKFAGPLAQAR